MAKTESPDRRLPAPEPEPSPAPSRDQQKYHAQREAALSALKHAYEMHGVYENALGMNGDAAASPQDNEAAKAFETLFSIYRKIPGGTHVGEVGKSNDGPFWNDLDSVIPNPATGLTRKTPPGTTPRNY